tara:strand:+ start:42 stop:1583 length:1542 start_codon:yes stop_codon:yes gene_type:complete
MAKETLNLEVKSNIKSVTKDTDKMAGSLDNVNKEAKEGIGNFQVMGVSLNGVKNSFAKIIPTAKLMFGTIKAGLISTGIGAFLVAIGSLVSYFTNTKRGADQLSKAFTAMGAVIDVIKDRISKVGEALSFVFSGEFRKAGDALKGTFAGIADEIEREVRAMTELKQRTQDLRDADFDFMIQKAATRQEIERARLVAEDETKSAKERLDNLKKALELEAETTKKELVLAKERMLIQQEEMKLSENLAEDEEKLAQLKVAFIETETASIKMRRRVVTEVNALEREINAEKTARIKEERDALKALQAADVEKMKGFVKMATVFEQEIERQIKAVDKLAQAEEISFEKKKTIELSLKELSEQRIEWAAMSQNERLNLAKNTLSDLTKIAGEETQAGKALAITQATIDTFQSAQASYKSLAGIPVIGPALGGVAAAAAVAMGLKNIAAIRGANSEGPSAGGSTAPPSLSATPPAPQMMSGAFQLEGGQEVEPQRAYVLSDDITDSQNGLAIIRRRATI